MLLYTCCLPWNESDKKMISLNFLPKQKLKAQKPSFWYTKWNSHENYKTLSPPTKLKLNKYVQTIIKCPYSTVIVPNMSLNE